MNNIIDFSLGPTCVHPDLWPQNRSWIGDYPPRPFDKDNFYILPKIYPPQPITDKPVNHDWNEIFKKLTQAKGGENKSPSPQELKASSDKHNFFPQEDGNLVFVLEMPGYGREHVSVKIKNDGNPYLEIEGDHEDRAMKDTFYIPDALKYNLHSGEVEVEHGILTITFESADYNKQEITLL